MTVIFNLGISSGFSAVEFDKLKFPGVMSIDYVRIYRKYIARCTCLQAITTDLVISTEEEGLESLSCDGAHPVMPTVDYIKKHAEVRVSQVRRSRFVSCLFQTLDVIGILERKSYNLERKA